MKIEQLKTLKTVGLEHWTSSWNSSSFWKKIQNYLEKKEGTLDNNGRKDISLELNWLERKMQLERENQHMLVTILDFKYNKYFEIISSKIEIMNWKIFFYFIF